jgi:hypothetical protein
MQIQIQGHGYFDLGPAGPPPSNSITLSSSIKKNTEEASGVPGTPLIARQRALPAGSLTNVVLTGSYTGSPSGLQFSRNGGAWIAMTSVSFVSGVWIGTAPSQATGFDTIAVRFTNDVSTLASANFGLGIYAMPFGDSTASDSTGVFEGSSTGPFPSFFWDDGHNAWWDMSVNSQANWWPCFASDLSADQNCPVFIIPTGLSGNYLENHWNPPSGSSLANALAVIGRSGGDAIELCIGMLGANSVGFTTSYATYVDDLDRLAAWFAANIPGPQGTSTGPDAYMHVMADSTGGLPTPPSDAWGTDYRNMLDTIRKSSVTCAVMRTGANLTGQTYVSGGNHTHPDTPALGVEIGDMFWAARKNRRGPRQAAVTINPSKTAPKVRYDQDLSNAINSSVAGFLVVDSSTGNPVTVTAQTVTGPREVSLGLASPVVGTALVYFGSGRDAVGQTIPRSASFSTPDGRSITQPAEPFFAVPASIVADAPMTGPFRTHSDNAWSYDVVMV